MATSSSDEVHDFPCTSCAEEDINKKAVVFCVNCSVYFCSSCYRGHNRVSEARDHRLLYQDEFQSTTRQVSMTTTSPDTLTVPTEKCARHHGKVVDMFCEDHDVVCCSTCVSLEHRTCVSISYIPDVAGALLTEESIPDVEYELSRKLDKVKELKQDRLNHQTRIVNEKDASETKVKERRKAIDEYISKIEQDMTIKVIEKFTEIHDIFGEDVVSCDQSIGSIDTVISKFQTSSGNASQTFINVKQAKQLVKETEMTLKTCQEKRNDLLTIGFNEGTSLTEMLSPTSLFGRLDAGYKIPSALKPSGDIHIKHNSDNFGCDCVDLCQLVDGTIIITDYNNKNIKSLKYEGIYILSDCLAMSYSPWGVCSVNDTEVAVTVPKQRKVYFVSVGLGMALTSSFTVDCECNSIAYAEGRLYVGHHFDFKLTVYDLQGNYLQTISTDQTGEPLFANLSHICTLPDKQQIIVADSFKGLVVIDLTGKLISRSPCPDMDVTHVCLDDIGNVYLTDNTSRSVSTLGCDNIPCRLTEYLCGGSLIPQAIFFDRLTERLIVCSYNNSAITTFSIHYVYCL